MTRSSQQLSRIGLSLGLALATCAPAVAVPMASLPPAPPAVGLP